MHKTPNFEVIPGILESSWEEIEDKINTSQFFASTLHIDIIDGIFVNNHTFLDPKPFVKYASHFTLELHMMVKDPIQYIEPFAQAGFSRFIGHIEMMNNQQEFIKRAKHYGEAGIAFDGPTSIQELSIPIESVDAFLVYTSERVGFSGPPLLPERLNKVKELRNITSAPIEVDGGITDKTIILAKEAGATRFAATSFIFSQGNPQMQFDTLNNLISD